MLYQIETIPEEFYKVTAAKKKSCVQESYWPYTLEESGISSAKYHAEYQRIDKYWAKVSNMKDKNGHLKYEQLFCLVKCVFSSTHGNSVPKRGFFINKILLDVHGTNLDDDTIIAFRLVKDAIVHFGGIMEFNISSEIILFVEGARSKMNLSGKRSES